jgi:hypothetical protein
MDYMTDCVLATAQAAQGRAAWTVLAVDGIEVQHQVKPDLNFLALKEMYQAAVMRSVCNEVLTAGGGVN